MLYSSKSGHFTNDDHFNAYVLKFRQNGKFVEGREFRIENKVYPADGLKVIGQSTILFAGAAKGINEVKFSDNFKSFFVMKFDFEDEQKFSCLDINKVNTGDVHEKIKRWEGRFEYTTDD